MVDLYTDEPTFTFSHTTYRITIPNQMEKPSKLIPYVYVEVDQYNMITVDRARTTWIRGFSPSENKTLMEIYEWLIEWELAEWRDIGPEDRELFATEKLKETKC